MNKRKPKVFCGILVFVSTALTVGLVGQSVSALKSERKIRYSNYQVYFYDPDADLQDCIEPEDPEDPDNPDNPDNPVEPSGPWDGHCSNIDSYSSKIEQYFEVIYSVARNNGLPWEGIVAQLIGESRFMKDDVCAYNPLGLKGSPSCDGEHRIFSSYEEAFNYYVNSIRPVREAKGKFTDDPYGYVDFLINGVPGYKYATDPDYINKISGHVCGVQKWAQAHGKPISGKGPNSRAAFNSFSGEGSGADLPYCPEDPEDPENPEGPDCVEEGNCGDYVFPLKGATKANYMHGSSLSPLPCNNMSMGGCHHDYYAMDLGLNTGTKTENDYPDLVGKFSEYYWRSVGVKVVAMTSGKIVSYKPYNRATLGYNTRCASVTYEANDGRKFWLGHMLYDSKYKAGDSFSTGQVMGEVGPPPCAISTQAHLHVDETPRYGSGGSVETVKLINTLYERLP